MNVCSTSCGHYQFADCSKYYLDKTEFAQTLVREIEQTIFYSIDPLFKERTIQTGIERLFASIIDPIDEIIFSLLEYSNEYITEEMSTGCLAKYPSC